MSFYKKYRDFWVTCDDGYTALTYAPNNGDDRGEVVCYIDAGDSLADLTVKVDEYLAGRA